MSRHNCENCTHKVVCALWEIQNELCDSECTHYQPTLTPQNKWVSVDERLPPPKQNVLAYSPSSGIAEADYADGIWMQYRWSAVMDSVTHWMPLPAPPGNDNNAPTKKPNEPLTLEELREMDGEPVWVVYDQDAAKTTPGFDPLALWALVEVGKNAVRLTNKFGGRTAYADDQELEWAGITAYRRPPEGEEDI